MPDETEPPPVTGWRNLSAHAAIYIGSAGLNAIFPFLLIPLLARWLGAADFGTVAAFLAAVNLAVVLTGLSAHGLISVAYFREGPDTLALQTGAALGVLSGMTLLAVLIVMALPESMAMRTGVPKPWLFAVLASSFGQFVLTIALAVFQTRRQPYRFAAVQLGYGAGVALLTVVLVGGLGMDWKGRASAQTAAALVVGFAALIALSRTAALNWRVRSWPIGPTLAFGLPLLPHALGAAVLSNVDRFVLNDKLGPVALGHYFLALQISSVFVVLATAVGQAWQPWLFERLAIASAEARAQVVRATYGVFALFACAATALALLAPVLIPLIAGPGFAPAVQYLRILAPAAACQGIYIFFTAFIFYERRTGLQSMITVAVAIVQTGLTLTMASTLGAIGVAYATLVSSSLYLGLTWLGANWVHPMPWFGRRSARAPA